MKTLIKILSVAAAVFFLSAAACDYSKGTFKVEGKDSATSGEDGAVDPQDGGSKDPIPGSCKADSDCPSGNFCQDGFCFDPSDPVKPGQCADDAGCEAGFVCEQGACVKPPVFPIPKKAIGEACNATEECTDGLLCIAGACGVKPNPVQCSVDADCGKFHVCDAGHCKFKSPLIPGLPQDLGGGDGPQPPLPPAVIMPQVVSVTPADKSTGVSTLPNISVTFNTDMDAASVKQHFKLYVFAVFGLLPLDVEVSGSGKTFALYVPATEAQPQPIKKNTFYQIRVEAGVKDLVGTMMSAEFKSDFTTHP